MQSISIEIVKCLTNSNFSYNFETRETGQYFALKFMNESGRH